MNYWGGMDGCPISWITRFLTKAATVEAQLAMVAGIAYLDLRQVPSVFSAFRSLRKLHVPSMRVLLIEDDDDLGSSIVEALSEEGIHVHWEQTGNLGLYRAQEWEFDLIILDRMLPELNGMDVLRQLRLKQRVPVLMLTALNTLRNRLEGFDGGADDYMGKPFELSELYARVRALLRRSSKWGPGGLTCGDVRLDPFERTVFKGEDAVVLSATEFAIVELLLARKGRPVARQAFEDLLHEDSTEIQSNSVEVHIHRIRAKLGKDFIRTRRGVGYIIEAEGRAS